MLLLRFSVTRPFLFYLSLRVSFYFCNFVCFLIIAIMSIIRQHVVDNLFLSLYLCFFLRSFILIFFDLFSSFKYQNFYKKQPFLKYGASFQLVKELVTITRSIQKILKNLGLGKISVIIEIFIKQNYIFLFRKQKELYVFFLEMRIFEHASLLLLSSSLKKPFVLIFVFLVEKCMLSPILFAL